jgi:hypothetical protein
MPVAWVTVASVALALALSASACHAALVAEWPLEEGKGEVAHDIDGGHHGTIHGAQWVADRGRNVLLFDGEDDCIEVPADPALSPAGALTLEAWVKLDAFSIYAGVIARTEGHWAYMLGLAEGGAARFSAGEGPQAVSSSPLPTGIWTHLVGTFDGRTARLYLNGELSAEVTAARALPQTSQPLNIGRNARYYFRGALANLRLLSQALSADEVQARFRETAPLFLDERAAAHTHITATKRSRAKVVAKSPATYHIRLDGTLDGENTLDSQPIFGRNTMERPLFEPNVSLTIENVGETDVIDPWIVINGRRDWFSIDTLLAEAIKEGMSDEEKAFAIWMVFKDNFYHYNAAEGSKVNGVIRSDFYDPIKMLNCYENNGCSTHAINLATLWQAAGLKAQVWNFVYTHWISQVFYDGGYHMLDGDMRVFYPRLTDGKPASIEECIADRYLIKRTHCYGDFAATDPEDDIAHAGWYLDENSGHPYEAQSGRTMGMRLRPGEAIVRRWDNVGKFHDNSRHVASVPKFANGQLVYRPDLSSPLCLDGAEDAANVRLDAGTRCLAASRAGRPARLTYRVKAPWVIVGGAVRCTFRVTPPGGRAALRFSYNGDHWWSLWKGSPSDEAIEVSLDEYIATRHTNARYEYLIGIEFTPAEDPANLQLAALEIVTDLQMSLQSLPALTLGRNTVVYRDACTGPRRVRITHEWQESRANWPPRAPASPVAPADGGVCPSLSPVLEWSPAEDPEGDPIVDHRIRIRRDPEMRVPVSPDLERVTGSGQPKWQVPAGRLRPGQAYYWQVKARDELGAWSEWSPVWSFTPEGPAPPAEFDVQREPEPRLKWSPAAIGTRPVGYAVYGSAETGFIPDEKTKLAEVQEAELRLEGAAGEYAFFRVVAIDEAGRTSAASSQVGVAGSPGDTREHTP